MKSLRLSAEAKYIPLKVTPLEIEVDLTSIIAQVGIRAVLPI
jgi:hypothetical protein